MKIVQSFSVIDNLDNKLDNKLDDVNRKLDLYLYSMLLSYLTLKKYYGSVTMVCDSAAYNKLVKHIPFDEVIIRENPYKSKYGLWNLYKIEALKAINEPFIHVDSDVFIYGDIMRNYINNDEYNISTIYSHPYDDVPEHYSIVKDNVDLLKKHKLMVDEFGYYSCGIFGIKNINHKNKFIDNVSKFVELFDDGLIKLNDQNERLAGCIGEEYGLYVLDKEFVTDELYDVYVENDKDSTLFRHLIGWEKYDDKSIEYIKEMIYKYYPESIDKLENINSINEIYN